MARAKKSSLDTEEPVVVEGEEVMETVAVKEEPVATEKAEEKTAVTEKTKKQKAEAQEKPMVENKAKRGVKICVF